MTAGAGGYASGNTLSLSHSQCVKMEVAREAERKKAFELLPPKDRREILPYYRPDASVQTLSTQVQATFSRYPQFCARVHEEGADQCLHCLWRFQKLEALREQSKSRHRELHVSDAPEMDILHLESEDSKFSGFIPEDMPACFDMPKIRGLFDLAPQPARRERQYQDGTVTRLLAARPRLDMKKFLQEPSDVFVDWQVRQLCENLMTDAEQYDNRCSRKMLEKAASEAGLMTKLTQRKISRAFDRLIELESREHENRTRQVKPAHEGVKSAMNRARLKVFTANALAGKFKHAHDVHASPRPSEQRAKMKPTMHDLRRKMTQDLDQKVEDKEFDEAPTFHFLNWLRASEHSAVQMEKRISAGDDVEWCLSIHDLLDTTWPWKPQEKHEPEEPVPDEVDQIFRGMLLGVATRPVTMSSGGPTYASTTISGVRLRDGAVLHQGRMVQHCPLCSDPSIASTDAQQSPSVHKKQFGKKVVEPLMSEDTPDNIKSQANLVFSGVREEGWTCARQDTGCPRHTPHRWICRRCARSFCEACIPPDVPYFIEDDDGEYYHVDQNGIFKKGAAEDRGLFIGASNIHVVSSPYFKQDRRLFTDSKGHTVAGTYTEYCKSTIGYSSTASPGGSLSKSPKSSVRHAPVGEKTPNSFNENHCMPCVDIAEVEELKEDEEMKQCFLSLQKPSSKAKKYLRGTASKTLVRGDSDVPKHVEWISGHPMMWGEQKVPHEGQPNLHKRYQAPIGKSGDTAPAVVVMRLDRRQLEDVDLARERRFSCRLWIQRLSGCKQLDEEAQVLVDDLGIDNEVDLYPVIYASRPESDIRHAVKLRGFPVAWARDHRIVACRTAQRPGRAWHGCQVYTGMADADPTVGFHLGDKVLWQGYNPEKHRHLASTGGRGGMALSVEDAKRGTVVGFPAKGISVQLGKYTHDIAASDLLTEAEQKEAAERGKKHLGRLRASVKVVAMLSAKDVPTAHQQITDSGDEGEEDEDEEGEDIHDQGSGRERRNSGFRSNLMSKLMQG